MKSIDRVIIRIINRLILLHLLTCAAAVMGLIYLPLLIWEFHQETMEARELYETGTEMSLLLVRHEDERFFKGRGHRFFFREGDTSELLIRYSHRDEPSKHLDTLTVYSEPLRDTLFRVVEVPDKQSTKSVYQAIHRKTWSSGLLKIIYTGIGWLIVSYIAVRGYILIKGKRR